MLPDKFELFSKKCTKKNKEQSQKERAVYKT